MQYFRNFELVKQFPVSEKAVRNWIDAARQGKNSLALHEEDGKFYIANTAKNLAIIEGMVENRKKFATKGTRKTITPSPEFYKIFSRAQILDIFSCIDIYREIPLHYNYFNGGAHYWDEYTTRHVGEDVPNSFNAAAELLKINRSYINSLCQNYKRVNIIDLGPGNCMPVKHFLANLMDQNLLGRYIAIDLSKEMLHIAKQNIHEWFKGQVKFESLVRDFSFERFGEVAAEETLGVVPQETLNLVLLLGGTPTNFRSPAEIYRVVHNSMGPNDLLICSQKLDSPRSRRFFDFNTDHETKRSSPLAHFVHRLVLTSLNIEPDFYEPEMDFDPETKQRFIRIKLKVALIIEFEIDNVKRQIELDRGDTIVLWHSLQQTRQEITAQLDSCGFDVRHTSRTQDGDYLLTISGIKIER